jgi:hypothetical protein
VKSLFSAGVLWRGVVYAILMALAKCMTGIWIFLLPATSTQTVRHSLTTLTPSYDPKIIDIPVTPVQSITLPLSAHESRLASDFSGTTLHEEKGNQTSTVEQSKPTTMLANKTSNLVLGSSSTTAGSYTSKLQSRIYPAILLALAMTTRGEIGFLISAVGQSSGLLIPVDVYLIVQWGIVLCTLGGPIGVGLVVRKIRQGKAVLGNWGEAAREDVPV